MKPIDWVFVGAFFVLLVALGLSMWCCKPRNSCEHHMEDENEYGC